MRYTHLSMDERQKIAVLRDNGCSLRLIGALLAGRSPATISRELRRNGGAVGYEPVAAHRRATNRLRGRVRPRRFADARLAHEVRQRLADNLSPEQIVGSWSSTLPRVSVATIYAWLYRERPWWRRHLRHGWARLRRSYRKPSHYRRIRGITSIDERPLIVAQRLRYGDWESDTVRGSDQVAGLCTQVDRRSGYVVLAWVPDRRAASYNRATVDAFARHGVPVHTLTVDHGMEFALFTALEQALACSVYFAHPHCAWERGCNENLNGLLRQYFPKNRDFRTITEAELRWVEGQLNARPRKRHGYQAPSDLMPHPPVAL
ncbi:MAG: IS30 family transposase [Verrucomicrobia bacterium]|nr:MAG: IS30 family transposase [Verrucomicrobiota bacterium]